MSEQKESLKLFLQERPGYLKKSKEYLSNRFKISEDIMEKILQEIKDENKNTEINEDDKLFKEFLKWKEEKSSPRVIDEKLPLPYAGNPDNVIFVGDLHAPWILDGYLEWVREQQEKYDCGTVIFAGDIIDGCAWSYHEHDVDGLSVGEELKYAKRQLSKVFKMFPEAISLMGNHDLLIARKMKTAGLSQEFMKDFGDILGAPKTWKFVHEYIKDNVRYIHGNVGDAFKVAKDSRMSTCQGHLHTQSFVQWSVSEKDAIFGLQVGVGLNHESYAFAYAKPFPKKPVVSCGLILEKGTIPFVKLMPL